MTWRALLKTVVQGPTAVAAGLMVVCYRLHLFSFLTAGRLLALVPGFGGVCLRRFWYRWTLAACGADVIVEWMAALKTPAIRLGRGVFIGSFCIIAECEIRDDVLVGPHSSVQGGGDTHGFESLDVPIRQQPGRIRPITIGPDVWVGTGARILADVSPGSVVAAGAVVTKPFPPNAILAGVPARLLRVRGADPQATRTPPTAAT